MPNGFVAKAQPKTTMPNLLTIFIITKNFHSTTTLNKKFETELLTIKFLKYRRRNRCRLEPLVRQLEPVDLLHLLL